MPISWKVFMVYMVCVLWLCTTVGLFWLWRITVLGKVQQTRPEGDLYIWYIHYHDAQLLRNAANQHLEREDYCAGTATAENARGRAVGGIYSVLVHEASVQECGASAPRHGEGRHVRRITYLRASGRDTARTKNRGYLIEE
jgi:hypothetical protein